VKELEIIADNLGKAGWSWVASQLASEGRMIWMRTRIAGTESVFVVRADEN